MARKGQFKKGGGRVGDGASRKAAPRRRRSSSAAPARRRRRRGFSAGAGAVTLGKLVLVGAGLGILTASTSEHKLNFLVGEKKGEEGILTKLPGYKSFGGPVMCGLICAGATAIGVSNNPWVKAAGYLGLGGAALAVGASGTKFKLEGDGGAQSPAYQLAPAAPPQLASSMAVARGVEGDDVEGDDVEGDDVEGDDVEGDDVEGDDDAFLREMARAGLA